MAAKPKQEVLDDAAIARIAKERIITGTQSMSRTSCARQLASKWIALTAAAKGESAEATEDAYQAFLGELSNMQLMARKLAAVEAANKRELESFEHKRQQLAADIQQAKAVIEEKKQELAEAKLWRKRQEEYEVLRQQIVKLPSRPETTKQLEQVQQDIKGIEQDIASHRQTYEVVSKKVAAVDYLIKDLLASFPQLDSHAADGAQPMQVDG